MSSSVEQPPSDGFYTYAVTHYGERLRDTEIAVSVWPSREAAIAAVRQDFDYEIDELEDDERQEAISDDEKLLEHLRWYSNIIVSIDAQRIRVNQRVGGK